MSTPPTALPLPMTIEVEPGTTVSALWQCPDAPRAAYVFAHGAGAGMRHAFMEALAGALAAHKVATLRYQFPFMERGSKRPDAPALAQATVRAAVAAAAGPAGGLPLFAGGKSFGGRMSSQAQAAAPLPGVCGLAFVGFPLHAAGKPATTRADHLQQLRVPMLFLQGTRDELADLGLLKPIVQGLGALATLHEVDDADHAFHVRAKSGRNDAQVIEDLAATMAAWFDRVAA
jgi:predicted alpha/beta-hydrolase family hydrolase